mmetsp:Transcript_16779/g.46027  ORF Transcript_16779/g.46027 Transcript_16779/m.46027 type:complete len:245 (+) Transcript_16779:1456-2190(+)
MAQSLPEEKCVLLGRSVWRWRPILDHMRTLCSTQRLSSTGMSCPQAWCPTSTSGSQLPICVTRQLRRARSLGMDLSWGIFAAISLSRSRGNFAIPRWMPPSCSWWIGRISETCVMSSGAASVPVSSRTRLWQTALTETISFLEVRGLRTVLSLSVTATTGGGGRGGLDSSRFTCLGDSTCSSSAHHETERSLGSGSEMRIHPGPISPRLSKKVSRVVALPLRILATYWPPLAQSSGSGEGYLAS